MIYQLNVIKKLFKSNFWKLFILYFIFYACMYFVININSIDINYKDFQLLIGIFSQNSNDFLEYLWIGFQVIFTSYISWCYIIYENNHSKEFLYLRKSLVKVFFEKLFIICVVILLIRLTIFAVSYVLLNTYIYFLFSDFIKSVILYIIIPMILLLYQFIIGCEQK